VPTLSTPKLSETIFGDTDLTGQKRVWTRATHWSQIIDTPTLGKSGSVAASAFCGAGRGAAGLPDDLLTILPSLLERAHPVHSPDSSATPPHNKTRICERLHEDIRTKGVRLLVCATEDMKTANEFAPRIDQSIHLLTPLTRLSEHSLTSRWVQKEFFRKRLSRRTGHGRTFLFLFFSVRVRLHEAVMQVTVGWASDVKRGTATLGDFTRMERPRRIPQAFVRLLRDLQAAEDAKKYDVAP